MATKQLISVLLFTFFIVCLTSALIVQDEEEINGIREIYFRTSPVPLIVALKQRNMDILREKFWQVSDPLSKHYGEFMTLEEITDLSSPTDESIGVVIEWLAQQGAENIQLLEGKDFIRCELTIDENTIALSHQKKFINPFILDEILDFTHPVVQSHIQFISPLKPIFTSSSDGESDFDWSIRDHPVQNLIFSSNPDDSEYDPNTQRFLYGIPNSVVGDNQNNSQMVWGTGTYGILDSDLKKFYEKFNINEDLSLVKALGASGTPNGANFGEASLDTQYISGVAPGIMTYAVNSNNTPSTESGAGFGPAFLDFVVELTSGSQYPFPNVLSISLGSLSWFSCDRLCQNVSAEGVTTYDKCLAYAQSQFQVCMYTSAEQTQRISDEFMEMGLRGMSIFAATGDGGCHYSFGPFPETNSIGRALNKYSCAQTLPTFPAESPYVVAVGGSNMDGSNPIVCSSETGCIVTGGGGFSWQFDQPSYQSTAVNAYLSSNSPSFQFNAQGRGYPDISTIATNVPLVVAGQLQIAGGTSASTPEMAAIISLINDVRIKNGLSPLGFINPALYLIASGSNSASAVADITSGNSRCGSSSGPVSCCSEGFDAVAGWDAASGWGQPLWSGLYSALSTNTYFKSLH